MGANRSAERLIAVGRAALALGAIGLTAAGCGGERGDHELTVSAAASLAEAFEAYGTQREGVERFSFGGSDALTAQIRQGARPDVFASSDISYPRRLHREGLVDEPVVFARNRLVIAVPSGSAVEALDDLAHPGVDLLIGADGVPAGDYARQALRRLPEREREAIVANVRSEEADVKGIVGKLVQGAAEAGFVYASDVAAAAGELRAVELPPELEPDVAYGIAIVKGAANEQAAREFIDGLHKGAGAEALREAGFLPPGRP
jgi:molybdate transport system substrate-binding protein